MPPVPPGGPPLYPPPSHHQSIVDGVHGPSRQSPPKRRGDGENGSGGASGKRHRTVTEVEDDQDETEGPNGGAKHWTEDEKDRLFRWLLSAENDEHFHDLKATKNSCLRNVSRRLDKPRDWA
jgi:hypothetical protein